MKSQVPIDQLLVWAFRDGAPPELGGKACRGMFDASAFEYGTVIDKAWGAGPSFIDDRHPDAIKIQEAVFALCKFYQPEVNVAAPLPCLNWTLEGTFFLGRWALRLGEPEILHHGGRRGDCGHLYDSVGVNPGALVFQHAVNKGHPRWDFQEKLVPKQVKKGAMPQWRLVCDNGFGKLDDISVIEIARARHEYHCWFEAIRDLRLPELEEYTPLPPDAPFAPWVVKQPMHPVKHSTHSIIDTCPHAMTLSQKQSLRSIGA